MKRAVLCIAHKAPEQLNVLIKQFLADAPETDIYFHVDKKAEKIKDSIMKHPQVFFIQNNHSITWGDDSTVRMLVDAFSEIVSHGKQYDYFQICTGQDLMVRPGLDRFLEENRGKIYLDTSKIERYVRSLLFYSYPKIFQKDLSHNIILHDMMLAFTLLTRLHLVPKKKVRYADAENVDLYYSFNWSFMPYEVLCYIDTFLKNNPTFLDLYRNTRLPEDGFLGTLIMNSPYRDAVVWEKELDCDFYKYGAVRRAVSLTFMRNLIGVHPPFLTCEDIADIENSQNFMARKFDIGAAPDVVDYFLKKIVDKEE